MQSHEKEINTPQGRFVLDGSADAKMASRLAEPVYPQEDVLKLAEALNAQKIVDVGAHVGTVSVPLARQGKHVTAFEPNPASFAFLQRNCAQNDVRVDIRNKGLGRAVGRASVAETQQQNAGAHSLSVGDEIEVSTLDIEVKEADLIKIDVEGMELDVLLGGKKLVEHTRPAVYFEVNLSALRGHTTHLTDLTKFFTSRKYRLYYLENETLYRVPSLTFAALCIAPRSLLFGSPSAPFDLVAIHHSAPLPYRAHGALRSVVFLITRYVRLQYGRFFR
jgi:FkbM family methyltransferase